MLLEFVAAIFMGFAAAGVVMAINVVVGRRLPAWLMPASAGLAMIAFMSSMEYSWLSRTTATLPEGVEVVSVSQETSWYRPWTYINPVSLRAVALDTRRNRTHEKQSHLVMTSVVLIGRWMPSRQIPVVFDCARGRRADLHDGVVMDASGALPGAQWRDLPADDAALKIACRSVS